MFNRHEITNILCKNLKFVRKNTQIENYQGKNIYHKHNWLKCWDIKTHNRLVNMNLE